MVSLFRFGTLWATRLISEFGAGSLLAGEPDGLAVDFTYVDQGPLGDAQVKDTSTPANNFRGTPLDLLTFTSPSVKMTTQSDGNIKHGPHNLIIRSNDFDDWGNSAVSSEDGISGGPIGTYTKLTESSGSGVAHWLQLGSATATVGLQYRVAVRVKQGTVGRHVILRESDAVSSTPALVVNLTTGTIDATNGTVDSSNITPLSDGWYLVEMVITATDANGIDFDILMADGATYADRIYDGDGSSFINLSGAQLHVWPSATDYVRTTANAVYQLPYSWGLGDDQATYESKGILVEEARTNLCTYSTDISDSDWTKTNTDVPTTNNTSPSGETDADEIAATSSADQEFALEQAFTSLTATDVTVCSVFLKAGTRASGDDFIQLGWEATGAGSDGCFCNFNLTSGVAGDITAYAAGTATDRGIIAYPNGWYRCWIAGAIASGTVGVFSIHFIDNISAAGKENANLTNNDSVLVWQADVNADVGAFPLSPIITGSASVTRAADDVVFAASGMPSIATAFTVYSKINSLDSITVQNTIYDLTDSARTDRHYTLLNHDSDNQTYQYDFFDGGASQISVAELQKNAYGGDIKGAFAASLNDIRAYKQGASDMAQDTSATMPDLDFELQFGANYVLGNYLNGHILELMILPRAMTNAEMIALTGPTTELGSQLLAYGEGNGLFLDFTYDFESNTYGATRGDALIRDATGVTAAARNQPYDILTYTSPATKMMMQDDGFIKHGAHNLCLQSENISTTWTNSGLTRNTNQETAPDGSSGTTADKLTETATDAAHVLTQSITLVADKPYTLSAYFKAGTTDKVFICHARTTARYVTAVFNLTSATVTQTSVGATEGVLYGTPTIEAVGSDGWYRCTLSSSVDTSASVFTLGTSDSDTPTLDGSGRPTYLGSTDNAIFVWGMQASAYPAVTTYLKSTTSSVYELPYEFDTSGNAIGIHPEEQRVNLLTTSNDFAFTTNWGNGSKFGLITANAAVSPSGETDATRLSDDSSTGNDNALTNHDLTITAASYTCTVYAKADQLNWVRLRFSGLDADHSAYYDLENGVTGVTTADDSNIESVGNGWYRCDMEVSTTTDTSGTFNIYVADGDNDISVDLDGTSSIFIWGAQVELGAFPTSLIPTYGATATRAADNITEALSNTPLPDLTTSGDAISLFGELSTKFVTGAQQTVTGLDDDSTSDRVLLYFDAGADIVADYATSGGNNANPELTNDDLVANTTVKVAGRFTEDDTQVSKDGNTGTADTDVDVMGTALATIYVGSWSGGNEGNINIKKISIVPRAKSDAELVDETS